MGAILLENGIQTGSRLLHGMTPEQEDLFLQLMQLALENVENHPISSGEGMLPPESCDPPKKGRHSGPVDRFPRLPFQKMVNSGCSEKGGQRNAGFIQTGAAGIHG